MSKKPVKDSTPEVVTPTQTDKPKFRSTILQTSISMQNQINKWVGDLNREWKLVWRASENDFDISSFHQTCDGIGETVTIVRVQKWNGGRFLQNDTGNFSNNNLRSELDTSIDDESNHESPNENVDADSVEDQANGAYYIFGGYLKAHWHSQNKWIRDTSSFIFTLTEEVEDEVADDVKDVKPDSKKDPKKDAKSGKAPTKGVPESNVSVEFGKRYIPLIPEMAALGSMTHGPSFGQGDLYIAQYSNMNRYSSSVLGNAYKIDTNDPSVTSLAGSNHFSINEIEVFTIDSKST